MTTFSSIKIFDKIVISNSSKVKSLKSGNGQLSESYISIKHNEVYLNNAHIKPLTSKNYSDIQNPTANRKLLLNKKEINMLHGQISQKGLTLVPIRIYSKNG